MAMFDDRAFLITHIRNSFITSDDTGMSELILEGDDVGERHLSFTDKRPISWPQKYVAISFRWILSVVCAFSRWCHYFQFGLTWMCPWISCWLVKYVLRVPREQWLSLPTGLVVYRSVLVVIVKWGSTVCCWAMQVIRKGIDPGYLLLLCVYCSWKFF